MVTPAQIPRKRQKCIRMPELVTTTAKQSGYLKYEVHDILKVFIDVLRQELAMGHSVSLPSLCVMKRRKYNVTNVGQGHLYKADTVSIGLSVVSSKEFKAYAKEYYNEPNNKDNPFLNGTEVADESNNNP